MPSPVLSSLARAALVAVSFAWPLSMSGTAAATTFYPPSPDAQLVGHVRVFQAQGEDSLMDIARLHGVGYKEMRIANPHLKVFLSGESHNVIVPAQYILPDAPREGIVLNRSEMRLYYYHRDEFGGLRVTTYPVGIGREDRQTPLGAGRVTMKLHKPTWYPTPDVLADYAAHGKELPRSIPAGPDNPLGEYAIMLDLPGYMIHGTNRPDGVGMLVSQGCVRLYPEDIEALAQAVPKGTPVTIVDQPVKLALAEGRLLAEVHPWVYGLESQMARTLEQLMIERIAALRAANSEAIELEVDWDRVRQVARQANGIPQAVGKLHERIIAQEDGTNAGQ